LFLLKIKNKISADFCIILAGKAVFVPLYYIGDNYELKYFNVKMLCPKRGINSP